MYWHYNTVTPRRLCILLTVISITTMGRTTIADAAFLPNTDHHSIAFDRPSSIASSFVGIHSTQPSGQRRRRQRSESHLRSSFMDSDKRPNRPIPKGAICNPEMYNGEWGIMQEDDNDTDLDFPNTAESVVNEAFAAVAGTVCDIQKMDPNVAVNAASHSVFEHRPVRTDRDSGRMGIELDGTQILYDDSPSLTPQRALRRTALLLAAKMSNNANWKEYEDNSEKHRKNARKYSEKDSHKANRGERRPVLVYFNTVRQALMASKELALLKYWEEKQQQQQEQDEGAKQNDSKKRKKSAYDKVVIQSLGDKIPPTMRINSNERRKYRGLASGFTDATQGLILVVQPTDYNSEYRPPGPAVDAVCTFQALCAQASLNELPVIALSPRFLSNEAPLGGWDQSGYQKSSMYGGVEPPKGPTPWVMRDFTPPIYCWVGKALSLGSARVRGPANDETTVACAYSRLALAQSVMYPDHLWRLYVAKECYQGKSRLPTSYHYLASTRSASGRPTRATLQKILAEFSPENT